MRLAFYYTPPEDHPLTRTAERWLGRSAFREGPASLLPNQSAGWQALTAEPRRYGFHATIKAPFRLREGATAAELEQALADFCAARPPCPIGRLRIARIASFIALVPAAPPPALAGLAADAVTAFDRFRAPLTEGELQRRLHPALDEVETANLMRWGYPYVFDRFRFHMTLTGPVEPERQDEVLRRLDAVFAPLLGEDFTLDALSIFAQDSADADFVVRARVPLRSPVTAVAG